MWLNFVLQCPRESRITSACKKRSLHLFCFLYSLAPPMATWRRESENKASDIHRPFCPFLCSSSPWIKYKEKHKSFQKFRFAQEVSFSFPVSTIGRIIFTMPLYKKIFIKELVPIFPSGNKIGKIFIFTRFEKFFHHKEAWSPLRTIMMTTANRQQRFSYISKDVLRKHWFNHSFPSKIISNWMEPRRTISAGAVIATALRFLHFCLT